MSTPRTTRRDTPYLLILGVFLPPLALVVWEKSHGGWGDLRGGAMWIVGLYSLYLYLYSTHPEEGS